MHSTSFPWWPCKASDSKLGLSCADAELLTATLRPQALRQLSLVNVRITAAPAFEACQVDIDSVASYMGRGQSRLASLFGLLFRRSSCQHPLLAAALGKQCLGSTLRACRVTCTTAV